VFLFYGDGIINPTPKGPGRSGCNSFETYSTWVAVLPPLLLLAQLYNSLRNKSPLTQQKICLEQVGGTEGDQCSIYIHSVLSTIHPFEATYQGTQSHPHSTATTTEDWKK